ncbi:uncharacterized protein ColSpa_01555 [Colletotrichum spaethianum]|uniref:Uncharacterized protein n=1 Tax=Colletotrichum spaethianum TaxID=700344 RepID=A0AA37P704_9PEZI|nr:uncharacterized protein ColSpa_01555 [Colletotrichum spaethianum]GKT41374.1 hypothetical protein ColSpa_01555 [Colletotrichum spaethianum]
MMHFLGHRRSASQQSIDPETQQQPQQQWRPHHQHRLSASSALYQAAQALGSIGVPTAAATANAASGSVTPAADAANANNSRPPLPNPVPSSLAVSSHSQRPSVSSQHSSYGQYSPYSPQQQQQQRQSGYFQLDHNRHDQPPAASGPVSSPPTSSLQYTPGAASATTPAIGLPLPKEPPVANFRWDDEYYNTKNDTNQ